MMFRTMLRAIVTLLAASLPYSAACAQQAARSLVSGHVFCQDTNGPARLARVTLTPLHQKGGPPGASTLLDGTFNIPDVSPGRYLITAELPGYVSSFSFLDANTRTHLNKALAKAPDGAAIIDVSNGLPVNIDLTLQRGAAISGIILYDDGSPAIGMMVELERENKTGTWESVLESSTQGYSFFEEGPDATTPTDSAGHFRIDGLPAGNYIVHAFLPKRTITLSMNGNGLGVYDHSGEQLDLYSGGAFWRKQAKPISVGPGDNAEADLEIPLGRLQKISGSVVAVSDGHPMTEGAVTLAPQNDAGDTRSAVIERDGSFHFLYVPSGDYIVTTKDAADGERLFGMADTSVHVGEQTTTVTLSVPERRVTGTQQQK